MWFPVCVSVQGSDGLYKIGKTGLTFSSPGKFGINGVLGQGLGKFVNFMIMINR